MNGRSGSISDANDMIHLGFDKDIIKRLFAKARRVGTRDHEFLPSGGMRGGNEY